MARQRVFTLVKDLPPSLVAALRSVDYHAKDVALEACETVSLYDAGGAGRQGFSVLVNIATGETRTEWGSWGGANAWSEGTIVDNDKRSYPLPEGGAVVHGSRGYPRTFATIYVNPANLARLLPSTGAEPLTDKQRGILYAYDAIKAGEYRKAELRSIRATEDDVAALVASGYLKRAANGATSITTLGKNARAQAAA